MGQHPAAPPRISSLPFAVETQQQTKFAPKIRSIHEGYGYLWEAMERYKHETFQQLLSKSRVKGALLWVGAMSQRIAEDLGYIPTGLYFPDYVAAEVERARAKHPQGARSLYEGLAIIQEEFEEFKEEVFAQKPDRERARSELVQIAAMAQRISEDLGL